MNECTVVFLGCVGLDDVRPQAHFTNSVLGLPKLFRHVRIVGIAYDPDALHARNKLHE